MQLFELVATVIALGTTDPIATLHNKHVFPTEEKCMNYGDTEQGAVEKNMVTAMAKDASTQNGTEYKVEFTCVPLKPKGDGL